MQPGRLKLAAPRDPGCGAVLPQAAVRVDPGCGPSLPQAADPDPSLPQADPGPSLPQASFVAEDGTEEALDLKDPDFWRKVH